MRVVIIGPGAIGCLFAGYFAKKKQNDIWILDKNARRAKRLRENGIKIETSKMRYCCGIVFWFFWVGNIGVFSIFSLTLSPLCGIELIAYIDEE